MARPRKDRTAEYSTLLIQELVRHLSISIDGAVRAATAAQRKELTALRAEIRALNTRLEAAEKKKPRPPKKLGHWVPGGPGRPPKDAANRIAAFTEKKVKRRTRRSAEPPPAP